MKIGKLFLIAAVAGALAGCKPADSNNTTSDSQAKSLESKAEQTAQASRDYAYEQKNEFVAKMNDEISNLKAQAGDLEAKVASCTGSTREELKARVEVLRLKIGDLNKQLEKARDSNAGTWENVKSALQKGTDEAKDSFTQARQWLSDKIKP